MFLASVWAASVTSVHAQGLLRDDGRTHSANSNAVQIVYLCDITMSSGGAVSLPEEVRWVWVCVWGGVDGRSRASSVASVSNQALGRLLFVPGKEVWRRFIFWAEAGGINSPNEPEAIFYPQWPAMFPTSGRSVTQQHEVWAYYPGSYVPSGHLLSFGKIPLGSAATRV